MGTKWTKPDKDKKVTKIGFVKFDESNTVVHTDESYIPGDPRDTKGRS